MAHLLLHIHIMEEQNTIREQITKEQQRNIYLSQLLKNLEEKLVKAKNSNDRESFVQNRAELQLAQMKNLDKRIQIYKHQLQKLKDMNTNNIVSELRKLRGAILDKEKVLDETKSELSKLQDAVGKLHANNMGKEKNKQMEMLYGDRKYQMRILHKKLKGLENQEYSQSFKSPPKKSARSSTLIVKDKEMSQSKIQEQKKGKIDKYAMYKNLIRFYTQEEGKLKTQIESLTKQLTDNKNLNENIQIYQQKIAALTQKK